MVACEVPAPVREGVVGREPELSARCGTIAVMATNELPEYADRVLDAVERIPPGRVMTYGDVAAWLRDEAEARREAEAGRGVAVPAEPSPGVAVPAGWDPEAADPTARRGPGPRQVGRVMALYGGGVPWWRVVRADGVLLPGHERRVLEHYRAEGTPLREPGSGGAGRSAPRLDLRRARWPGSEPADQPTAGRPVDAGPPGPPGDGA